MNDDRPGPGEGGGQDAASAADGRLAVELAATFERHEAVVPAAGPLRERLGELVQRRRRRRAAARFSGVAVAIAVAVLVALVPVVRSALAPAGGTTVRPGASASGTAVANYLLLGTDQRAPGDDGRPDTIIVVHLPAGGGPAYLVSLSRDLLVRNTSCGAVAKLNCPFTAGGAAAEAAAVSALTGVRFDGAAVVRMEGLSRVVDALGGVTMCVDEDTPTQFPPYKTFERGCGQHFDGATALDYVRQRENIPDGDYGRQRHTQQLVAAIAAAAVSSGAATDPARLARLVAAAGDAVTVDADGVPTAELLQRLADRYHGSGALVGLHLPEQDLWRDGTSYQQVGTVGAQLLAALDQDRLAGFAREHPELVNTLR
jgi:LCP family protein required for cell wall assembly